MCFLYRTLFPFWIWHWETRCSQDNLSKVALLLSCSLPLGTGRPQWGLHRPFSFPGWIALTIPDCPHRSGAPALWSSLRPSSGPTWAVLCPYFGSSRAGCSNPARISQEQSPLNIFPMWFYFAVFIQLGRPNSWSMAFAYHKFVWILEMAVLTCSRDSPSSH